MDKRLFRFRLFSRIDIDTRLRTPAQFNNRKSLTRVREGREKFLLLFTILQSSSLHLKIFILSRQQKVISFPFAGKIIESSRLAGFLLANQPVYGISWILIELYDEKLLRKTRRSVFSRYPSCSPTSSRKVVIESATHSLLCLNFNRILGSFLLSLAYRRDRVVSAI